jgi:putative transposase
MGHRKIESFQVKSVPKPQSQTLVGCEQSLAAIASSVSSQGIAPASSLVRAHAPIHRLGPWRNLQAVEMATLEWVDWFNHRRLLEPIGNIPPAEAEAAYYAKLAGFAIAA